jgi:Ni/Fe-hydrogenase subunit HybB-like protein
MITTFPGSPALWAGSFTQRTRGSVTNDPYSAEPLKINWGRGSLLFGLLLLIGMVSFVIGISGPQAQRVWQAYLINFVFWFGMAAGSILFVAILNMTHARWGRPLKRLAEALGAFLPVSFILFWLLYGGRTSVFPWIHEPVHGKEKWLNVPFLFARDGIGIFVLTAVATALIGFSVRSDSVRLSDGRTPDPNLSWKRQIALSPVLGILYALVLSLLAFDLIMSLDPHWTSTLFGGYFFVGSFYIALAALTFLSALLRKTSDLEPMLRPRHFHDLGKLLFGFCMMTGYLFYSQFLVVWYGNLPEETRYVIERIRQHPWVPLPWIILGTCFAVPFFVLLVKKLKMNPRALMGTSVIILIGMWLERFLLVSPSLWKSETIPLGVIECSITAGFLGSVGLTVILFLRKFPLLPVSDPLFRKETERVLAEQKKGQGAV